MQTDEYCVRSERDGIRHSILAGGKVNRLVSSDRFLQCLGVVGGAVAAGADISDVYPCVHGRQIGNVRLSRIRQALQKRGVIDVLDRRHGGDVVKMESVGEGCYV